MQRKLVERRAAGQAEHVQRAAELLRQFQSLRDAAPGLSPGKVLEQVSPADRGSMLETLLLASASQGEGQLLWAVAGPNLVRIDPRTSPPKCELLPLPTDLGPLRSVQAGEIDGSRVLLIGGQSGVMVADPHNPAEAKRYADRDVTSALGFNSVVTTGGMIWATHGQAGVVAWHVGQFDKPAFTIRPQGAGEGPRNAVALDDSRILYSTAGAVFSADRAGTTSGGVTSVPTVIHIAIESDSVFLIRADGTIDHLDRDTLQRSSSARHCGDVTAAATLPWLGTNRLLLATADGPICCVGADDPLVTQYTSVHQGLRARAATGDVIAAISPDRQRLVLWKTWETRQPAGEIHIAGIARHRAADVCFA
jgi:hypothetical protein